MYFSHDRSVGGGCVWGLGGGMGDWVGDGMLAGGEDLKWRGVNFTKEIPLNKFSENIKILLKLEKNVKKGA